jgi:predicted DNA binding CopG/RHH family protein
MKDNYTKEEQEILEALEEDRVSLVNPSPEELAEVRKAASESLKKSKRITIRLYKHDYIAIQEKASEMGLPYQTLISSVIHRYVDGDLAPRS